MLGTVLEFFGRELPEKFVKKAIINIKKEKFADIIKKIKKKYKRYKLNLKNKKKQRKILKHIKNESERRREGLGGDPPPVGGLGA